uniref:Uncharacterized protein n=1 Tax=Trichuris muris TaxID=70415 RepID=A0A5S6QD21_TRIMR
MAKLEELIVLKHAESVDRLYKNNWIDFYDNNGQRKMENRSTQIRHFNNIALPLQLPRRSADMDTWLADPPLSTIGIMTAEEVGRRLKCDNFNADNFGGFVYSSPCLCCVQTADCLLRGLGAPNVKIRIEPSIANWRSQHQFVPPTWLTATKESYAAVANIDDSYEPLMKGGEWKCDETLKQLIKRLERIAEFLLKNHVLAAEQKRKATTAVMGSLLSRGSAIVVSELQD